MIEIPSITLEICVVVIGIFLLMAESFFPTADKKSIGWTAVLGLGFVFVISFLVSDFSGLRENPHFYVMDPLGMFFKRFMLLATALTIILAMDYAPVYSRYVPSATPQAGLGEFFILPIFACAGLMWMVSAADFIMIFVALELVTITFYILVASMRRNNGSLEAGVKYLILGALSTGFLVYGITWLFGLTGQTALLGIEEVAPKVMASFPSFEPGVLLGLGLVLVALGFKVGAAPFQFWIPDVYQGAPTPVTAYLSVASKAAGFIVLYRVVETFLFAPGLDPVLAGKIVMVLAILAGLTLLYGNLAALPQNNLKRLLAYSSIAHAGYLLVAMASLASPTAKDAIAFYLGGYLLMTFLSFFVMVQVANVAGREEIADFAGLGRRAPALAFGMLVAMLSLAGLPFTVGFYGKFMVFVAAWQTGHFVLVAIGAVTVACGFYYYLKVVMAMYWQPAPDAAPAIPVTRFTTAVIFLLVAAIFVFGVWPEPILAALK
jgi:NADH-quinone oxidoreductase subunit N